MVECNQRRASKEVDKTSGYSDKTGVTPNATSTNGALLPKLQSCDHEFLRGKENSYCTLDTLIKCPEWMQWSETSLFGCCSKAFKQNKQSIVMSLALCYSTSKAECFPFRSCSYREQDRSRDDRQVKGGQRSKYRTDRSKENRKVKREVTGKD